MVPITWASVSNHMGERVEADHVGGAVGGALRSADLRAGERIHFVEAQAQPRGVVHDGQNREHPDAVGHEVGRVLGAHDALAQARGQPGFELVEHGRFGRRRGDQLHQRHVARRIEEVNAAEAPAQGGRHAFGQQ